MPSYLPLFALGTLDLNGLFEKLNFRNKVQDAKQNLFAAIDELNQIKFKQALHELERNDINVLNLTNADDKNPLTSLVQKCQQDLQTHENLETDCKHKAQQILKIYPAHINKEQIKLKQSCSLDTQFKQRCITCDEMLQLLLAKKYVNLGDYSISAMQGFRMAQFTTIQPRGFNISNYKKILTILALGNDSLLAEVLIKHIAKFKTTKRSLIVS